MVMGFSTMWRGEPTNFEAKIMDGTKWHSIRAGNRWSEGRTIQFATGVRTKAYRQFAEDACLRVQAVKITPSMPNPGKPDSYLPRVAVKRGEQGVFMLLAPFEVMALAINDGFESAYDLNRWAFDACRAKKVPTLKGQIVMWNLQNGPWPTPY